MSASQQTLEEAAQDLLDELQFQKVLLASIDDTVADREAAENLIKAEIKSLEKQLKNNKRQHTAGSASQPSASQTFLPPASSFELNQDDMEEQNYTGSLMGHHSASSTASTPDSNMDPLPDLTSPSMDLPTRKRSHSKHLGGDLSRFTENKSRRTSPSPFATSATTPQSLSSDDDFPALDEDFFMKQQSIQEDRIKRERADAEMARRMQEENSPPTVSVASSSRNLANAPSAFDRIRGFRPGHSSSSQRFSTGPEYSAPTGRKLPWSSDSITPRAIKSEGIKAERNPDSNRPGFAAYASSSNPFKTKTEENYLNIKAEFQNAKKPMTDGFIDADFTDDSDIEVIDATSFQDNGRYNPSPQSSMAAYNNPFSRPNFSPESQTAGNAALRRTQQSSGNEALRIAMFGKTAVPNWMHGSMSSGPSPNSVGNVYNVGQAPGLNPFMQPANDSVYGAANPNGVGSMPGAWPSVGMPGPSGLGYTMDRFPPQNDQLNRLYGGANSSYMPMPDQFGNMSDAMADQFDYIVNDPRKTNEEIKALLENIRPDIELPAEDREGTPEGLVYPLYEHQKLALTWLKSMEESKHKGGILADDMGLGKTISSLALILSRPSANPARKTTLIVGPVALVRQWEREIRKKVDRQRRLSTHMVHGSARKLSWDELRNFDIVLTTYGTLAAEYKRLEKFIKEQGDNGHHLDRDIDPEPLKKQFPLLGPKSLFYRVILDEAQCIKNKGTVSARATYNLKSIHRFCLSGTPMMNNIGELYSLIHFLQIRPYNDHTQFRQAFGMLTKGDARKGDVKNGMLKLQAFLKAIMLRRVKGSLIDGKPIVILPPKTEEIQHVVFDEDEQEFYNTLENKTKVQFSKYMRAGTVGKNYSNILVLLLRLRQACCHPHLITHFDEAVPVGSEISVDVQVELAKGLSPEVIARLTTTAGSFECPICYDAVINPSIIIPCGHDTCSECLTQIVDSQRQQNVAAGEEGDGVKCPTCRGKIDTNKVINYTTFKKVHLPDPVQEDEETASETDSDDDSDTASEHDSESISDADSNGDLRDFIVPDASDDDETRDEGEGDPTSDDEDTKSKEPVKRKPVAKSKEKEEKRRQKIKIGKSKANPKSAGKSKKVKRKKTEKKKFISIAKLKKDATRSADARRRYLKFLRKHWQPSAKVTKCVELLGQFQADGQKTIVFSQFVSLLDLLQVPIDDNKWVCERYDGSMNAEKRNDAIIRFTDDPKTNIMLISLKAGNAGLNLVAASRVIILDPFWNPYIEMQAVDRAYRIGQQRPVEVHRILIQSTVEDRIVDLQEQKKALVEAALDEGASKSVSRLGERELAFLFGVNN